MLYEMLFIKVSDLNQFQKSAATMFFFAEIRMSMNKLIDAEIIN